MDLAKDEESSNHLEKWSRDNAGFEQGWLGMANLHAESNADYQAKRKRLVSSLQGPAHIPHTCVTEVISKSFIRTDINANS